MKNCIISLIALLTMLVAWPAVAVDKGDVEQSLNTLDRELAQRESYMQRRQNRISALKRHLTSAKTHNDSISTVMKIGDAYNSYNNDSALIYYTLGYDISDPSDERAVMFRLKRATILPLSGFMHEAIEEYNDIDEAALSPDLHKLYHESGRQMYSYISAFYQDFPQTRNYWKVRSDLHRDSLLLHYDPSQPEYDLLRGERMIDDGNYVGADTVLTRLLTHIDIDSNLYARACHMLSRVAQASGNDDERIYYLASSASADMRSAVLEVVALQELGRMMLVDDQIDRAYNYLDGAMRNATDCNAMVRIIQSTEWLPDIQDAHERQLQLRHRTINTIVGILLAALLTLGFSMIVMSRQHRRQAILQARLQSANATKDAYISRFFSLCSIYIDRLKQFANLVNRKISAGQTDELLKTTKSGKFIEEQTADFYRLFDDAFLHIYPNFVEDVNKLLKDKIVLKDGEMLNNDLRILASMRMGLSDANRIALILNFSVNTVYAYRNRLRNRAYNRDTFEEDIMNIQGI